MEQTEPGIAERIARFAGRGGIMVLFSVSAEGKLPAREPIGPAKRVRRFSPNHFAMPSPATSSFDFSGVHGAGGRLRRSSKSGL